MLKPISPLWLLLVMFVMFVGFIFVLDLVSGEPNSRSDAQTWFLIGLVGVGALVSFLTYSVRLARTTNLNADRWGLKLWQVVLIMGFVIAMLMGLKGLH